MPRSTAPFDGSRVKPVNLEFMAQFLEKSQFELKGVAIGCRDMAVVANARGVPLQQQRVPVGVPRSTTQQPRSPAGRTITAWSCETAG